MTLFCLPAVTHVFVSPCIVLKLAPNLWSPAFRKHRTLQNVLCQIFTRFLHWLLLHFGNFINLIVALAIRIVRENFPIANAAKFEMRLPACGLAFHFRRASLPFAQLGNEHDCGHTELPKLLLRSTPANVGQCCLECRKFSDTKRSSSPFAIQPWCAPM